MSDTTPRIPEAQARALWQRAIELQMSADRRRGGRHSLQGGSGRGYTLAQIVEAAEGAGIEPESVAMALAESRLPDAAQVRRDRRTARWVRALLRRADAIEVAETIPASPSEAIDAFDAVVRRPAFSMVREDRVGPAPPVDGVLVYRIEGAPASGSSFHSAMQVADGRVVLLSARDLGERTVLRLRLPHFEHGVNLALAGGLSGGLGTAGGFGGASLGGAIAGVVGTVPVAIAAAPVAAGALLGGVLGLAGCRGISRWGCRRGELALRRLLQAVAAEAEAKPS